MGTTAMSSAVSKARPTAVSTIRREGLPACWVSTLLRTRRRDSTTEAMASVPPSLISTAAQSPAPRVMDEYAHVERERLLASRPSDERPRSWLNRIFSVLSFRGRRES